MTKHLVRLQWHLNSDRGQGALEYIGILAVVGAVIGLAFAAFNGASGDINTGVKTLIKDVFTTS